MTPQDRGGPPFAPARDSAADGSLGALYAGPAIQLSRIGTRHARIDRQRIEELERAGHSRPVARLVERAQARALTLADIARLRPLTPAEAAEQLKAVYLVAAAAEAYQRPQLRRVV